ncbi:MAG: hypothetical protein Q9208_005771, partial [Pyrenodesmia sp. 3 TL-2023]
MPRKAANPKPPTTRRDYSFRKRSVAVSEDPPAVVSASCNHESYTAETLNESAPGPATRATPDTTSEQAGHPFRTPPGPLHGQLFNNHKQDPTSTSRLKATLGTYYTKWKPVIQTKSRAWIRTIFSNINPWVLLAIVVAILVAIVVVLAVALVRIRGGVEYWKAQYDKTCALLGDR